MTFIDDYSKWAVLYTMKEKSECSSWFMKYQAMMERETGRKIKILRSDRGGEYVSSTLKQHFDRNGMQHQFSAPYTPQQNGVAERYNRTVMELVRAMLHHKSMDKKYWAEALSTACYIRNRVTSRGIPSNTTPYEIFKGTKPKLSHLRVFGSRCWYAAPRELVRKLDSRANEAIFLGYATQSKAYKLWDARNCKIVISRNVVFDEDSMRVEVESESNKGPENPSTDSVNLQSQPDLDEDTSSTDSSPSEQGGATEEVPVSSNDLHSSTNIQSDADSSDDTATRTSEAPRRSARARKAPGAWWKATAVIARDATPESFSAAVRSSDSNNWMDAMKAEISSLDKNNTWTLVPRSEARNILTPKWVFRRKEVVTPENGDTVKYKARLCARGFQQIYGIDYTETFSPVVTFTSIRTLLALVAAMDLELEQMDVVTAFLNGNLDEVIFMEQPQGFKDPKFPDHVCKLLKALYGLKQSPRQWNAKINSFLVDRLGFVSTSADACLYVRHTGSRFEAISLYVDDLLIAGNNVSAISSIKKELGAMFEMKDLGPAKLCLGLEITRSRNNRRLLLGQQKYVGSILERFGMQSCKPASTPMEMSFDTCDKSELAGDVPYRELIGCLMYLMIGTRPDIAFAVGKLAQAVEKPQSTHWVAAKRVLRYIQGTIKHGIVFGLESANLTLEGMCDADWAGCRVDRKSTSGYVFKIGGAPVSWCSRKQCAVALSSTEAEYISMSEAAKEAIWLSKVWSHLRKGTVCTPVQIQVDNQGAICVAKNTTSSRRTKHIDIRYHFVRDQTLKGTISFEYCPTEEMHADILTKPLARVKFEKFRKSLAISSLEHM